MKMSRKKILIILIILIAVIAVIFLCKNKIYESYINSIKYDISITYNTTPQFTPDTGYSGIYKKVLVNTEKNIAYYIFDEDVYYPKVSIFEKGHHYKVKKIKLTEEQIKDLLAEINSGSQELIEDPSLEHYYYIEYENNKFYCTSETKTIDYLFAQD